MRPVLIDLTLDSKDNGGEVGGHQQTPRRRGITLSRLYAPLVMALTKTGHALNSRICNQWTTGLTKAISEIMSMAAC